MVHLPDTLPEVLCNFHVILFRLVCEHWRGSWWRPGMVYPSIFVSDIWSGLFGEGGVPDPSRVLLLCIGCSVCGCNCTVVASESKTCLGKRRGRWNRGRGGPWRETLDPVCEVVNVHTLKMFLFCVPHLWGTTIHTMGERDARFETTGMPTCRLGAGTSSTVDVEGVFFSLLVNPSCYYADDDKERGHEEQCKQGCGKCTIDVSSWLRILCEFLTPKFNTRRHSGDKVCTLSTNRQVFPVKFSSLYAANESFTGASLWIYSCPEVDCTRADV